MRIHDAIGAERRIDLRRQARRGNLLVIGQRVCRIVGRADRLHAELSENALRAELRRLQPLVGLLPHARGRLLVQQLVDAEVALQLEMRPVIERVAQAVRHGLRPRQELVVRIGVARAEPLGDAARPHRAPLVVVAFQPDFEQICEPAILGDVLRRKMAVIVDDRLRRRVRVKQPLRGLRLEQEVVVDEAHGSDLQEIRRSGVFSWKTIF